MTTAQARRALADIDAELAAHHQRQHAHDTYRHDRHADLTAAAGNLAELRDRRSGQAVLLDLFGGPNRHSDLSQSPADGVG